MITSRSLHHKTGDYDTEALPRYAGASSSPLLSPRSIQTLVRTRSRLLADLAFYSFSPRPRASSALAEGLLIIKFPPAHRYRNVMVDKGGFSPTHVVPVPDHLRKYKNHLYVFASSQKKLHDNIVSRSSQRGGATCVCGPSFSSL
eukprot:g56102.t1